MKRVLMTAILALAPVLTWAHGDHAPQVATCQKECTKEQVELAIPKSIEVLSEKGKIDLSWTKAKVEKVEKKKFKKGFEWVATLYDENQKDETKQRLYIFITLKGYLNGSNFTGE